MRLPYVTLALGMAAAWLAAPLLSSAQAPPARMAFMETLSEWRYPGSNMLGGATMSDGGNPAVEDVKCRAVLTTPDPIEKVIKHYSERFGPDAKGEAQAVFTQDDSKGRPVTLRIIVVSKADRTTTLVISRADGEKETHIAWSHYRRFDAAR